MQTKISVRLEQGNRQRLDKLVAAVKRLPDLERARWLKRIAVKLKAGPGAVVGGEWGTTEPTDGTAEWDLELANWLDNAYGIVSDRAEVVFTKTKEGVVNTVSDVGFSIWPLAIGVAVVLVAFGSAKRSH